MTADEGKKQGQVVPDLGGWISGPSCGSGSQLDVVPCQPGYVDLLDARHPDDRIHVRADEFAAFALMIKGGVYDNLFHP